MPRKKLGRPKKWDGEMARLDVQIPLESKEKLKQQAKDRKLSMTELLVEYIEAGEVSKEQRG